MKYDLSVRITRATDQYARLHCMAVAERDPERRNYCSGDKRTRL